MEHNVLSSIREIVSLSIIGTLMLFFIAEIVLVQDVFFVHPVVVIAVTGIAIILWYRGRERRVT